MAISFDDEELFWEAMLSGGYEGDSKPAKTESVSEPDEETVSPEEKMSAAMLANEAMKQEEANAEKLWNLQGRPVVTPEMAAGFRNEPTQYGQVMPTSRGFMYVGAPPPADEPNAGYDRMKAAGMIQPPSRRLTPNDIAWTPAYDQFSAQQDIKAAVARGVPLVEALAENPAALAGLRSVGTTMGKFFPQPMSDWQQRNASLQEERLALQKQRQSVPSYAVSERNSLIRQRGAYQIAIAQTQDVVQKAEYSRELKKVNDLIAEWDATYGTTPETPTPDATMTRVAPPPGAATSTGAGTRRTVRAGDVIKGYRFKGGNPNDKNNWEKL